MKEHGILFSAPMVRALLDGSKTQTRRIVTDRTSRGNYRASELLLDHARTFADPGPSPAGNPGWYLHSPVNAPTIEKRRGWKAGDCDPSIIERLYPWAFSGDQLWVRETWMELYELDDEGGLTCLPPTGESSRKALRRAKYRADGEKPAGFAANWKPSIFMPRWASRITLEITITRAERLQDISEADAMAEGITHSTLNDPRVEYRWLWESINGPGSWDVNPWVWAVQFRRLS